MGFPPPHSHLTSTPTPVSQAQRQCGGPGTDPTLESIKQRILKRKYDFISLVCGLVALPAHSDLKSGSSAIKQGQLLTPVLFSQLQ